jgi:hypothetical protein
MALSDWSAELRMIENQQVSEDSGQDSVEA